MSLVYLAINRSNSKRYIGVTRRSLEYRKYHHINAALKGASKLVFHAAIRKHGKDAFEFSIVQEFADYETALAAERKLISELKPEYNTAAGGRGPMGTKWSKARRAKMAISLRKSWTQDRKDKIAAMFRGRRLTEEQKAKLRAAYRPELNQKKVVCLNDGLLFESVKAAAENYGLKPINVGEVARGRQTQTGNSLSFVFSQKPLSKAKRDQILAELGARRQKERDRIKSGTRNRAVRCSTDGAIFKSGILAASHYGLSRMRISQLCNGNGSTKSGLRFEFVTG